MAWDRSAPAACRQTVRTSCMRRPVAPFLACVGLDISWRGHQTAAAAEMWAWHSSKASEQAPCGPQGCLWLQAKQDMHRDLAEATVAIQDIVNLVRKQAAQIKQDAARSHADIAAARRRVQTSFAEHSEACRCALPMCFGGGQLSSLLELYGPSVLCKCCVLRLDWVPGVGSLFPACEFALPYQHGAHMSLAVCCAHLTHTSGPQRILQAHGGCGRPLTAALVSLHMLHHRVLRQGRG